MGHRLHLPERWTSDTERCRQAGVPDEVAFATEPAQAAELIGEAIAAREPFGRVAADGGYGQYTTVRHHLREQRGPTASSPAPASSSGNNGRAARVQRANASATGTCSKSTSRTTSPPTDSPTSS
ncbi:transposase [Streptomyces sp. NPDC051576]|uniref:transposase n=1 Tax=Streptomyces sp. NPDC051576 TaxID=3155803 RepID=UPI003431DB2F